MYQLKHNLGTFVEQIMSNTAEYYIQNNMAYFKKAHLECICFPKDDFFSEKEHIYRSKGDLDFYGVYKGRYFSVELKETTKEIFSLSLIKNHQLEKLKKIYLCGGISLLLIHFSLKDSHFILLSYLELLKLLELKGVKKFSLSELKKVKSYELKIIYPSIFNLIEKLDQILLNS